MARMLGERVLPEQVNNARRRVRARVSDIREPIRQRRQQLVPGPDLIGRTESMFRDLRDRFVSREGLLSRIRSQQEGGGQQEKQQDSQTPAT